MKRPPTARDRLRSPAAAPNKREPGPLYTRVWLLWEPDSASTVPTCRPAGCPPPEPSPCRDLSALYIRIGVARFKQRDLPAGLAAYQKSAELFEKQLANDAANTLVLRYLAIARGLAGEVHEALAKTANPRTRHTHLAAAKENYQHAVDVLLKAQAQKALPEVSRKLLEKFRRDIEGVENSG